MKSKNSIKKQALGLVALALTAALGLMGCQADDELGGLAGGEAGRAAGDELVVEGTLAVPGMAVETSRGVPASTAGSGLKLTILEFDKGATASESWLTNVYHATVTSATTAVANGETVNFTVELKATADAKQLHFFVADDYVDTDYGSVASILPTLTVGSASSGGQGTWYSTASTSHNKKEAYWGCVDFPDGYATATPTETTDADGNTTTTTTYTERSDLKTKLTEVPVIRNFAKVTVTNAATNFDFLGFDVVNVPASGTIAPWNASGQAVPSAFVDANGTTVATMPTYSALGYSGVMPAGITFDNTEDYAKTNWKGSSDGNLWASTSRYLYEHPYESTRRTYLIVCGKYNGGNATYYKVELGRLNAATGTYDIYNIIRNFNYNVTIRSVSADGRTTVADAINGSSFNAIVAETSVLAVSDGNNLLEVDDTNHIVVSSDEDDREVTVRYRYTKNITSANTMPYIVGSIPTTGGSTAPVGGDTPSTDDDVVIMSVTGTTTTTAGNTVGTANGDWYEFTVKLCEPTAQRCQQAITIVDGSGLSRTIYFILRTPWEYGNVTVKQGADVAVVNSGATSTDYGDNIDKVLYGTSLFTGNPDAIGTNATQELSLYFNLPDGLPEEMFPLEFDIESYLQGIENNKKDNLVVKSGNSYYSDQSGKISIFYRKTVSYREYRYKLNAAGTGYNTNEENKAHTIRCMLSTISKVDNNSYATLLIHSPYFKPASSVAAFNASTIGAGSDNGNLTVTFQRTDVANVEDTTN